MEVNSRLKLKSLNIRFKDFKSLVEDSAVVCKQLPLGNNNTLNIRSVIDLFFNQAEPNAL